MLGSTLRLGAASPVGGMNRDGDPGDRGEREQVRPAAQRGSPLPWLRRDGRDRRPEDRGHEGRAFDQSVAASELLLGQMVGEDAVFHRDRTEPPGHAEQAERDEQQRQRMHEEANVDAMATAPNSTNFSRLRDLSPCRSGRPIRRRAPTAERRAR